MMKVYRQTSRSVVFAALAAALLVPPAWRAHAIDGKEGDLHWSWDTTLTYGLFTRLEKRDPAIVGLGAGGKAFSVNGDDGNLNYDTGIASNAFKATTEIELSYKGFGAFVRAYGFYDTENEDGSRARTPLSEDALDRWSEPGLGREERDRRGSAYEDSRLPTHGLALAGSALGLVLAGNIKAVFAGIEAVVTAVLGVAARIGGGDTGGFAIFSPTSFYLVKVPSRVLPREAFFVAFLAIFSCTFAAYAASRAVSRFRPAEVLRHE